MKTLYQQKLEKERSRSVSFRKGAAVLFGLTLLLVLVVFILPSIVQDDNEDMSTEEIDENPILIPNQEILAQKPIAEALLSELLIKIESLKLKGFFLGNERMGRQYRLHNKRAIQHSLSRSMILLQINIDKLFKNYQIWRSLY